MDRTLLTHDRWYGGRLLTFSGLSGPTDVERGLLLRSLFGEVGWEVKVPGAARIHLPLDTAREFWTSGDAFYVQDRLNRVVRGAFVDAYHLLIDGYCTVSQDCDELALVNGGSVNLLGVAEFFNSDYVNLDFNSLWHERNAWIPNVNLPEHLSPAMRRATARAIVQMRTQVCAPQGRIQRRWTTPDRWPHRDMWLWDSAFHAIGLRHLDPALARETLQAVLDQAAPDGFIPHQIGVDSVSEITQPPVLAWAAWKIHETAPDHAWLEEIFPPLCRYLEWDLKNRDQDQNGLVEWMIEQNEQCRSGESGMDNSTRFDRSLHLDAVDFNAYLSRDMECLNFMARELGRTDDQALWRGRHFQLNALMRARFWDDASGFFYDYDCQLKQLAPIAASSGFLPLICGGATRAQAEQLLRHLHDPARFGTRMPLPSVARNEPAYELDMWRGPAWVNINWMVAEGLDRFLYRQEAEDLRSRSLGEILRQFELHGTFFEYFDPDGETPPGRMKRKQRCAPEISPYHQVFHDYGWTATLFLDWAWRGVQPWHPDLNETQ